MYLPVSSSVSGLRWYLSRVRCESCTRPGESSVSFSSGWPARMMLRTFSRPEPTPDNISDMLTGVGFDVFPPEAHYVLGARG